MENTNVERLNKLWGQLKPGDTIYAKRKGAPFIIAKKIDYGGGFVKGFTNESNNWLPINEVDIDRPKENHKGGRRRNRKSKRKARSRYSRRN